MDSSGVTISDIAAKPIWLDPKSLGLVGKQKDNLSELVRMLQSRQGQSQLIAECLLDRKSSISQPLESMRSLVAELDAQAPKQSSQAVLAILGRVVGRWNELHDAQLPVPEFPVRMPKFVPPFTPQRWAGLARYRVWADAVLMDIVRSAPVEENVTTASTGEATQEPLNRRVARVLASAVLWGGILCRKYLDQLYSSLPFWPEISECACNRVYVTWFDGAMNCRRWMPDPITTLTMMRLKTEQLPEVAALVAKQRVDRVLLNYIETLLPDRKLCPGSLPQFIDASLMHFELRLPRCLTEYAAGKSPSASPNPATWARMVHHKPLVPRSTNTIKSALSDCIKEADEQPERADDEGDDWVDQLRKLLGSGVPKLTPLEAWKAIKLRLGSSGIGETERLFLNFSADILLEHQRGSLKTVRVLVLALATKLPSAVDLKRPGAIPPDTLASAYSFLLDDASTPSQHHKLRGYLRRWHQWLVQEGLSQRIDEAEVFGWGRRSQTIDARLVMEDEYLRARDSLVDWNMTFDQEPSLEKDIRQITGMILILGYRAGLRKSECLKPPLDAFMLEAPAELLIRPWSELKLKTPNAVRKISLYALLDQGEKKQDKNTASPSIEIEKDELQLFETWARRRRHQNTQTLEPSPFFFYTPALDRRFVPEGRIFPLIHNALRKASGDKTVHFHTLRKSGAGTWLAFALLAPPTATLPDWLKYWPKQKKRILRAAELQHDLYLNEFATRRHLFATARNLGHSSPAVSLENYLELQGNLLGLWLETNLPDLNVDQIRTLAGVSQRSAYDYIEGNVYEGIWVHISRKWKPFKKKDASATEITGSRAPGPKHNDPVSIRTKFYDESPCELMEIQELLSGHSHDVGEEDLLLRSGYPRPVLHKLLQIATTAAGLTDLQDPHQHQPPPYVQSFWNDASGKKSVCPTLPVTAQDVEIVTGIGTEIFKSFREKRTELLPIARHWLGRAREQRDGLEFLMEEHELAAQYASFLNEFKALRGKCEIRYFGREERVEEWKEFLPSQLWRRRKPAHSPSEAKAESNSIGIKVLLGGADRRKGGASQTSAYGWRYLMLLASLWTVAWEIDSLSDERGHAVKLHKVEPGRNNCLGNVDG